MLSFRRPRRPWLGRHSDDPSRDRALPQRHPKTHRWRLTACKCLLNLCRGCDLLLTKDLAKSMTDTVLSALFSTGASPDFHLWPPAALVPHGSRIAGGKGHEGIKHWHGTPRIARVRLLLALFNLLRGLDTQLRLPLAALAHAADDKASNPLRRTCADSVFVFSIRASIADTSQHEHRAASGRRGGGSPGAASKSCSMSTLFTCESVHFRTSALLELRSADLFVPLLKSLQKKSEASDRCKNCQATARPELDF